MHSDQLRKYDIFKLIIKADWTNLHPHLRPLPIIWSKKTIFIFFLCIWLLWCSLYLIFNHDMFPRSMYCCIACLGCTDCSRMCACLPALCCWRWIVWCMHVSCFDSDVHSCFELWSALSQSSWIRLYKCYVLLLLFMKLICMYV